jgi:hypothetical protein
MTREAMLGPFTFTIFRRPKANLNPTIRNKKVVCELVILYSS